MQVGNVARYLERTMNEDLWESLFDRIENELKTGDIHTLYLLLDLVQEDKLIAYAKGES